MKKLVSLGLATALTLAMGVPAFAAEPVMGANYADADGNGVCDNIGTYQNFIDEDGDGICDNTGFGIGRCKNGGRCVYANGDGINDNIGSGNGGYFADEDGDGTCDNASTRQGMQKSLSNGGKGRNRN